ncbi:MAG: hypothetical protein PHE78_06745, partial [Candidatus Gastranaerophilales bacterium]|nr:hypothetical protein [Candidatus Gastranaerophilales bacterium]
NVKNLQVKGSIKVATNALGNKTAKTSTFTTAVNNILSADQATVLAQLLQLQIRQQKATSSLTSFYEAQTSAVQTLLGSGYSSGYGLDSAIYASLTNNNSLYNSTINNFYSKNLYDNDNGSSSDSTTKQTSTTKNSSSTSI